MLNTSEAARFLRVSEASIRRWSNAGLLTSHRVGRRRERRFAESDLVRFLSRADKPSVHERPAAIHVRDLLIPVPGHLATFYSSDAGRMRLTVPFLVEGLRSDQHCFLVAADDVLKKYMMALRNQDGVDLNRAVANGQWSAIGFDGATVDKAVGFWAGKFADIRSRGTSVIRHVGEMASVRRMFPSEDEMLRFEEAYDVMCRRYPVAAICQYDVREFDGVAMLRVLKSHPDLFEHRLGTFLN
ncbi:MAG: MEDS domain-containing protein [Candidatus Dormibacteraeota bacterium]|nr:MEDS domain-containing protein [Candidatus Dormibacteraeota bacterium]